MTDFDGGVIRLVLIKSSDAVELAGDIIWKSSVDSDVEMMAWFVEDSLILGRTPTLLCGDAIAGW
jgi:hypothetical protein